MRIVLSKKSIGEEPDLLNIFFTAIYEDAPFFSASYPEFDQWVTQKVIPGIYTGERTVVIEKRSAAVSGILIVKHTEHEKKVCTLRVRPHCENRGLGIRLFEFAFDLLDTDRPLLSVSTTAKSRFTRIFDHFGFSQEATYLGLYLPFKEEHSYNGILTQDIDNTFTSPTNNRKTRKSLFFAPLKKSEKGRLARCVSISESPISGMR